MLHELFKKQDTKEKIITLESQKAETILDNTETQQQKEERKKNIELRKQKELERIEELRNELTKENIQDIPETTPIVKDETKKPSKIGSFFRKAALGLGLSTALVGKVEAKTEQGINDKNQINNEETAFNISQSGENNISWKEAKGDKDIKKDLKKEKREYYHPKVEKGITSGNKQIDFLYYNQWLMKVPGLKNIIRDKAKEIAKGSRGYSEIEDLKVARENAVVQVDGESQSYSGNILKNNLYNLGSPLNIVDQYFSKKGLSPESTYKPISDYYEFLPSYSVKGQFDKLDKENKDKFMKDMLTTVIDRPDSTFFSYYSPEEQDSLLRGIAKSDSIMNNFTKSKKPIFRSFNEGTPLTSEILNVDLAGHKEGLGYDKDINLPYLSLGDAFDFEPNHYSQKWDYSEEMYAPKPGDAVQDSTYYFTEKERQRQAKKIQSTLLHKTGHPFKVYDRFYFDPKTLEYIDDETISQIKKGQLKGLTRTPKEKLNIPKRQRIIENTEGSQKIKESIED